MEFVTAGGYLPVRREAFEALLNGAHGTLADVRAESLYEAITTLYRDYSFYTPPLFERYGALQKRFDSAALEALSAARGMEERLRLCVQRVKNKFGPWGKGTACGSESCALQ